MNVFNRIVMILGVLFWIALVVFTMLDPLSVIYFTSGNLDYYEQALFDEQSYYMFIAGGGVLLLILLILLWLEIRHRRYKTVRIRSKGKGTGELAIDSVVQSLKYRVDELPGVRKVRPRVTSHGRDVGITLGLDTSPTVNIPVLTEQVVKLCQDVVEGHLGLKIRGKVRVSISHEPYPRGAMPLVEPMVREEPRMPAPLERPSLSPTPSEPAESENVIVNIDTGPQSSGDEQVFGG